MAEKKFLDSKKLDMEDLENVVGGSYYELSQDVQFLQDLGMLDKNFHGNYEQMQTAVNKVVREFRFQVIVNPNGQNIVRHFNRNDQPRNSNRELMYAAISKEVNPDFNYRAYL